MMLLPTSKVTCTMIGATALGSKCRSMIRQSLEPKALAASVNSRWLSSTIIIEMSR